MGQAAPQESVQWGFAYTATAWTLLQALEYAAETFHWPGPIQQLATIVVVIGLPLVVVVAWYHTAIAANNGSPALNSRSSRCCC